VLSEGWALYVFQQVEFALTYNYGYWLLNYLAKETAEDVRHSSVARRRGQRDNFDEDTIDCICWLDLGVVGYRVASRLPGGS
jgi:hypothetical protein